MHAPLILPRNELATAPGTESSNAVLCHCLSQPVLLLLSSLLRTKRERGYFVALKSPDKGEYEIKNMLQLSTRGPGQAPPCACPMCTQCVTALSTALSTKLESKHNRKERNYGKLILQSGAKHLILSSRFPIIFQEVLCSLVHHPLNLGAPMARKCSLKMQEPRGAAMREARRGKSGTEKLTGYKIWNKSSTRTAQVFTLHEPSLNVCGHLQHTGAKPLQKKMA